MAFVLIVYVVMVDGGEPDNLMSHTLFRSLKKLSCTEADICAFVNLF